jgi:sugar phosphate permease
MLYEASSGSLDYERANGVAEFGSGIAAVSAPLILGLVSDRFGVASAFWVIACFALAATVPALIFSRMKTVSGSQDLSTEVI